MTVQPGSWQKKLLLVLVTWGSWAGSFSRAQGQPVPGRPAPPFSLRDREGALVALSDLAYPGQVRPGRPKTVVVLDFFRTDCKPCRASLPRLIRLHDRLKGKKVRVLLIALLEADEGEAKLDRFLKDHPLPFTVLLDTYGVAARQYVRQGGKMQIPCLFVIDPAGVLQERTVKLDERTEARIEKRIRGLLR